MTLPDHWLPEIYETKCGGQGYPDVCTFPVPAEHSQPQPFLIHQCHPARDAMDRAVADADGDVFVDPFHVLFLHARPKITA